MRYDRPGIARYRPNFEPDVRLSILLKGLALKIARPEAIHSRARPVRDPLVKLLTGLSVEVDYFALCTLSTGWRMCLPGSPQVFVKFVIDGEGVVRSPNGRSYPISTGNLVIVPEGASYQIETGGEILHELRLSGKPEGDPPYRVCAGHREKSSLITACGLVSASTGSSVDVFSHLRELLIVDLSSYETVRHAFTEILEEQTGGRPGAAAVSSALMTKCLIHLFRHLGDAPEPPAWLLSLYNPRLSRTLDLILANPTAEHSLASLARSAAMSRSTFAELFRSTFGVSPMNFVTKQRVRAGAELLNQGLAVSEVAARVGFSSRSHFTTAFRKHAGVPPSQYAAH